MGTPQFPDLGKHCFVEDCKQIDFLPFTCKSCRQAIGYDFDYDEYHSFVHGRLPYENLKPDPVLRSLLLSLPVRKVIFNNADKVHALKVLSKLGLEDCFEGIICFETLSPTHKNTASDDEDDLEFLRSSAINGSTSTTSSAPELFDIVGHFAQPSPNSVLPKTSNTFNAYGIASNTIPNVTLLH